MDQQQGETSNKYKSHFEKEFAKFLKVKYAIMVNSGSSSYLVIFQFLIYPMVKRLKPGDEVLVPAICWSTSLWPIIQSGLKVKFVDIDLDTLNISLSDLEKNKFVVQKINENFDLSPRGIREMLGLNKPIYEKSAAYGHFGREPEGDGSFSWEKTDKKSVFSQ